MDAVEEVKQRLNIEDVVAQYVQLKRAGRNFKGLSPFTNEKTPSFIVSPEKQIWHDFSSGKGGNVFSFVMDVEGMDFKAALEFLARQAGVDLAQYQTTKSGVRTQDKEKLYELLELATKFYQVHLTKNQEAVRYIFKQRRFTKPTVLDFRIGYAPNNGRAAVDFLRKKGFSDTHIKQAGLGTMRAGGLSDMFRGRIMIPLADPVGRVIGFTARSLDNDTDSPKYINTPQTMLYDKGRHVYGLHLAKQAIRKVNYAVIVEGNLDVITSHQIGVAQVVATAGTALTEYHLKGLSRLTNDIRLSFDQDEAGIKASERAIPIASRVGVSLSIITTPGAKDPDELIKKDPAAWQQAITNGQYGLDWLLKRYQHDIDITTGQGKRLFSDLMVAVIKGLQDEVEQEHYLELVAKIIGVSKEALQRKLQQKNLSFTAPRRALKQVTVSEQLPQDIQRIQDHLLALSLVHPELRQFLQPVASVMIVEGAAQTLLSYLQQHQDDIVNDKLPHDLQSISDYIKILLLQYEELYGDLDILELHYEASRLQTHLIQQYVKKQKQALAERLQNASEPDTQKLLKQAKELDTLLRTSRGALND